MAAATVDLIIDKGATFKRTLILKDSSKNIIDITGYTASMQIRTSPSSSTYILELTTENGRITITGNEGKIELYISHIDTAAIIEENGTYDLELTDTATEVTKLIRGSVNFINEITK